MKEEVFDSESPMIGTGCGKLYLLIAYRKDGGVKRVQATLGKSGGCAAASTDAISFLIKTALKYGAPKSEIVKGLKGIGCGNGHGEGDARVTSCSDAIAKLLEKYLREKPEAK